MVEFAISWMLLPFGLFLLLFALFAFFNLYHMLRFSYRGFGGFLATFLFLGGTVLILSISLGFIAGIDWSQTVSVESVSASGAI